jgi:transposase
MVAIPSTMTATCAASAGVLPQQNGACPATRTARAHNGSSFREPAHDRVTRIGLIVTANLRRGERPRHGDRPMKIVRVRRPEARNFAHRTGPLLKQVEAVNQAIRDYIRRMEQIAETRYPETCLLKQIKGVGTLIALTYALTLQDPHRLARSRDVGAFLGFLPREKQSGDRAPRLGISRAGNE